MQKLTGNDNKVSNKVFKNLNEGDTEFAPRMLHADFAAREFACAA